MIEIVPIFELKPGDIVLANGDSQNVYQVVVDHIAGNKIHIKHFKAVYTPHDLFKIVRLGNEKIGDIKIQVINHPFLPLQDSYEKDKADAFRIITEIICNHFDVSVEQLKSPSRKRRYVIIRDYIFFFSAEYTRLSLQARGEPFGRDHASVLAAQNRLVDQLEIKNKTMLYTIDKLREQIQKHGLRQFRELYKPNYAIAS